MVKKILTLAAMMLLLTACGSDGNNFEKLHGKWQMDKQSTVEMSKEYGKMSKEMKAELVGRMRQNALVFDVFAKQIAFHFENDQGGIGLPFEVKKDSGDTIVISVNKEPPTKIVFEKNNKIIVSSSKFSYSAGVDIIVFNKVNN